MHVSFLFIFNTDFSFPNLPQLASPPSLHAAASGDSFYSLSDLDPQPSCISAMEEPKGDPFGPRLSFQENMELAWLPSLETSSGSPQRFVSTMPPWMPGKGLPWNEMLDARDGKRERKRDAARPRTFGPGAFGGHVYAQAPLAAARVVEKVDEDAPAGNKLGLHVSSAAS